MQHSFFDVTLKFSVLQRHFHKFCDTPSSKPYCDIWRKVMEINRIDNYVTLDVTERSVERKPKFSAKNW